MVHDSMKKAIPTALETTECPPHYMVHSIPKGITSLGTCKKCGEKERSSNVGPTGPDSWLKPIQIRAKD